MSDDDNCRVNGLGGQLSRTVVMVIQVTGSEGYKWPNRGKMRQVTSGRLKVNLSESKQLVEKSLAKRQVKD